ncbi:hypothetical protein D3C71_1512340 [compost metagenome]
MEKENRDFAEAIPQKYGFIKNDQSLDNAGIITVYLNTRLKEKYGKRDRWLLDDYFKAEDYLSQLVKHLCEMIESTLRRG